MDAKQYERLKNVGKCQLSAYGMPLKVRDDIDMLRNLEEEKDNNGEVKSRNAYLKECIFEIVRLKKEQYNLK